jgi:hypothetical protein
MQLTETQSKKILTVIKVVLFFNIMWVANSLLFVICANTFDFFVNVVRVNLYISPFIFIGHLIAFIIFVITFVLWYRERGKPRIASKWWLFLIANCAIGCMFVGIVIFYLITIKQVSGSSASIVWKGVIVYTMYHIVSIPFALLTIKVIKNYSK